LGNLLNNAAKYTPEEGQIQLSARVEGAEIVFRVRDTGIGIAPEMLRRVFDLFVQVDNSLDRSQGGLGIGLTLVRSLVELHGGSVQVFSDGPGNGSEFIVRLPALANPLPDATGSNLSMTGDRGPPQRRILVVDDNVDSAESLAMVLRVTGHQVRTAHDGAEALEVAAQFAPEIVLLDIGLPKMSGYEVARVLRSRYPDRDILIVALTGYGQEEDRRRSREAGFDHHLVKPVQPAVLKPLLSGERVS
jgi:CheY-like chemotaxis protein